MLKSLYDNFKHWYHGGTIYFYSDPHFGDADMPLLRKNNISDEEQVQRINSVVTKNDTIVFLGDIGAKKFIKQIKGYKVLVLGNHDDGARNYRRCVNELTPTIKISNADIATYLSEMHAYDLDLMARGLIKEQYVSNVIKEDFKARYYFSPIFNYSLSYKNYDGKRLVNYEQVDAETYKYKVEEDNKLFDEVYEGALIIGEKLILSHEPINYPYALNIHGHDHSKTEFQDDLHWNMCAENIDYTPVCINKILTSGRLKKVKTVHEETIEIAKKRKEEKKSV